MGRGGGGRGDREGGRRGGEGEREQASGHGTAIR